MRKLLLSFSILLGLSGTPLVLSNELGPAEFPASIEDGAPKSYHDAWCRELQKECKVIFSGTKMRVEGFKGIERKQLLGFRSDRDGRDRYFYVQYINSRGQKVNALFLFDHWKAAQEFSTALARWYDQDSRPYPNY